ncbi:hypothetical protein GALL_43540 [mine drainage metagenome]|uniref:Uncharacterized protein n=1 Tax=mine drainage metagenome TaxID=410659 RepID=A0A1J5T109_9ZZZZ
MTDVTVTNDIKLKQLKFDRYAQLLNGFLRVWQNIGLHAIEATNPQHQQF